MASIKLTKDEELKLTTAEELIFFYRANPCQAAKDLLDIELTWFQRKILKSLWKRKYVMLLLGRGIGKTWITALFAVLYALLYPGVDPARRQAMLSGQISPMDFLAAINFARQNPDYLREFDRGDSMRVHGSSSTQQPNLFDLLSRFLMRRADPNVP